MNLQCRYSLFRVTENMAVTSNLREKYTRTHFFLTVFPTHSTTCRYYFTTRDNLSLQVGRN